MPINSHPRATHPTPGRLRFRASSIQVAPPKTAGTASPSHPICRPIKSARTPVTWVPSRAMDQETETLESRREMDLTRPTPIANRSPNKPQSSSPACMERIPLPLNLFRIPASNMDPEIANRPSPCPRKDRTWITIAKVKIQASIVTGLAKS